MAASSFTHFCRVYSKSTIFSPSIRPQRAYSSIIKNLQNDNYSRKYVRVKLALGFTGILGVFYMGKKRKDIFPGNEETPTLSHSRAGDHHARRLFSHNFKLNAATKVSNDLSQGVQMKSLSLNTDECLKVNVPSPWHHQNPPSREIRNNDSKDPVKLTLYQYASCPFCCKVRAFLDYYGMNYNVVEVNSILKTQKKWSTYKRIPILVCDDVGPNGFVQMNDSSVIVSMLDSHRVSGSQTPLDEIISYYPMLESKEGKKTILEFPNKYFVMYGGNTIDKELSELREEREWREWVDANLVHMLSPNAYRTLGEAVGSFKWFSEFGEWEKNMSTWSRLLCIYAGATVMRIIGYKLKRKYDLDDDVRQSLYKSINQWLEGIGPSRQFMGGDKPNLADLAVYGVMCSVEGCQAFQDLCENTKFLTWYKPMQKAVKEHRGCQISPPTK